MYNFSQGLNMNKKPYKSKVACTIEQASNSALTGVSKSFKEYQDLLGYETIGAVKSLFKRLKKQHKIPKASNEKLFGTAPVRKVE